MEIELRKVKKEDCDLLYKWVNDPFVRKNAFNSKIIDYDEHKQWFNNKINSSDSFIYIGYVNDKPIGQIRIDIKDCKGIIDYSVDKNFRGKGFGTQLLDKIKKKILDYDFKIKMLVGKVKSTNIASQKAFERAGYTKKSVPNENYIEYYYYIINPL